MNYLNLLHNECPLLLESVSKNINQKVCLLFCYSELFSYLCSRKKTLLFRLKQE